MLELNKTYPFTVQGTIKNSKDETMYLLESPFENDTQHYYVFPINKQLEAPTPATLFCRVTGIGANGHTKLQQDTYALYSSQYKPNTPYTFTVIRQLNESHAGHRRYVLLSTFGHTHMFTAHQNEYLNIGDTIKRVVTVKKTDSPYPVVYFYLIPDLGHYTPEEVFTNCGHADKYAQYFLEFKDRDTHNDTIRTILQYMDKKIESGNRLWMFDYLRALTYVEVNPSGENLDDIMTCNIIIRDLELWLLEESGILAEFSPDKRNETELKSERIMEGAEATIQAIELIQSGQHITYLHTTLQKLRKSMYLRHREQVFTVLYRLVVLDRNLLKDHIVALSELIDFTSREVIDSYILGRIVNKLSNHINEEKKLFNKALHYTRDTPDTDHKILSNLIIGIGTLLRFHSIKRLESKNEYFIHVHQLFPTLCKYLSFMTTQDTAIQLIHKALQAILTHTTDFPLDGQLLRDVQSDPDALIAHVLKLHLNQDNTSSQALRQQVYSRYTDGMLSIVQLAQGADRPNIDTPLHPLYIIPGTPLQIASPEPHTPWTQTPSIAYYKQQWTNILQPHNPTEVDSKGITRRVTIAKINHAYKHLVFCKIDDPMGTTNSVIDYKGYASHFKSPEMDTLFTPGNEYLGEVCIRDNGQVHVDITRNIRDYSHVIAKRYTDPFEALCIGYDYRTRASFFLTEDGMNCIATADIYVKPGDVCTLRLQDSQDNTYYPAAVIIDKNTSSMDTDALLRTQLDLVSDYNKAHSEQLPSSQTKETPYIVLILDNFLRLTDDPVVKYNLYHILRLVAISENSSLAKYYSACIHIIEMQESFAGTSPSDTSIPNFIWDEQLTSQFPSLKAQSHIYQLLHQFGDDQDLEHLFHITQKTPADTQVNRLARLSLAASLLESVTKDTATVAPIRNLIASELGTSSDKAILSVDVTSDFETIEDCSITTHFGTEGQSTEFKTSAVYCAGTHAPAIDKQMHIILKVIAGFLNAKGGTLYIGVKDDGHPSGIAPDLDILHCNTDKYERTLRQYIVDAFNKDVNGTIAITFLETGDHQVCQLTIPPYITPIEYKDEFYQRQGNETRILKGADLVLFVRRRMEGKETIIEENSTDEHSAVEVIEDASPVETSKEPASQAEVVSTATPVALTSLNTDQMLAIIQSRDIKQLHRYFKQLVGRGATIPQARTEAQHLLQACNQVDDFWYAAQLLVDLRALLFVHTLAETIRTMDDPMAMAPHPETFVTLIRTIMDGGATHHHVMSILHTYKSLVSPAFKEEIFSKATDLRHPDVYMQLLELTDTGLAKAIPYLIEERCAASLYTIYQLLDESVQSGRFQEDNSFILSTVSSLPSKTGYQRLLLDMIQVLLLEGKPAYTPETVIASVQEGGYEAYKKMYKRYGRAGVFQFSTVTNK